MVLARRCLSRAFTGERDREGIPASSRGALKRFNVNTRSNLSRSFMSPSGKTRPRARSASFGSREREREREKKKKKKRPEEKEEQNVEQRDNAVFYRITKSTSRWIFGND